MSFRVFLKDYGLGIIQYWCTKEACCPFHLQRATRATRIIKSSDCLKKKTVLLCASLVKFLGFDKLLVMKLLSLLPILGLAAVGQAKVFDRQILSYAPIPEGTYVPPTKPGEVTLLDFIKSRDDLSELAKVVSETPG